MTIDEGREYVLGCARELYGRVVCSLKTHEKERDLWGIKASRMNMVNVLLTGLTTLFAVISAALTPTLALIATAVSAVATVVLVVWQGSFDPVGKENQQRTAAKELLWIREQLLLRIIECLMPSVPLLQLQKSLEMANRELTAVYKFAPSTSPGAYVPAEKSLKSGYWTFPDDEIDGFLASVLRKNQPLRTPFV